MSNFQAPAQNPIPPAPAPASGLQPPIPAPPKRKNGLGIAALIVAIVGFVFACMPGALIVGWVLLPVGFILGLVALFLRGKVKWQAVSAVIISVVGTIVGVAVFFGVVANAVNEVVEENGNVDVTSNDGAEADAVDADEEAVAEEAGADDAAEAGTRENPVPLGSTLEGKDWIITINSVTLDATEAVLAENQFNEAPADGNVYILVNYTVTYTGDDLEGSMPIMTTVEFVTAAGNTVESYESFTVAPDAIDTTSTLYEGASATGNEVFEVPAPADGVIAVKPGMTADTVFVAIQ
ncbi:hypothetical protein [Gulosibacter faecalis]|uniref:DUF4352 domain-containing protein n=1 Tax=Gulosibacter faecalis TaxID=272240 RepID=A0ABW5UXX2_9MICO|nr:hypothetical protein [Gulosibacter faecalis]